MGARGKKWRDYYSTILYVIIGDLCISIRFLMVIKLWTITGMLGAHVYGTYYHVFSVSLRHNFCFSHTSLLGS
jgi:hypothetical protein